jgi:hypothetical protein
MRLIEKVINLCGFNLLFWNIFVSIFVPNYQLYLHFRPQIYDFCHSRNASLCTNLYYSFTESSAYANINVQCV